MMFVMICESGLRLTLYTRRELTATASKALRFLVATACVDAFQHSQAAQVRSGAIDSYAPEAS